MTNLLELHILEIPKAKRLVKKEPENKVVQWMAFLDNPNEMEVSEMARENENIKEAMEKLEEVSEDEKLRRIAELREKAERDEASAISYAINKGKTEEKIEIARKLKYKNFSIDDIVDATGLTKEEIEKI